MVQVTKDPSREVVRLVKLILSQKMVLFISDSLRMINSKVLVKLHTKMAVLIQVHLKMVFITEKDISNVSKIKYL